MNMRLRYITFLFLFSQTAFGQSCLPNGITFSTQQQIDNFNTNNPSCTEILGDVLIEESINNNITSLNGLSQIMEIGGYLRIVNNENLINLEGLNNIQTIGGRLAIGNNPNLINLNGLESLELILNDCYLYSNNLNNLEGLDNLSSINGQMQIYDSQVQSVDGLESLTSIGDSLFIGRNGNLQNLSGLENLNSIGGYLYIGYNDNLQNLDGLNNLTNVEQRVYIDSNPDLINIHGLENLHTIGDYLALEYNHSLIDLSGLESLESIGNFLWINSNNSLKSLWGIQNIDANTILSLNNDFSDLEIHNNPLLSHCEIQSICEFLNIPNRTKDIYHNATGCDDENEILEECNGPPCTQLYNPIDNEIDVPIITNLIWDESENAIGYKLTIGTESEIGNILDNEDVGNEIDYNPINNFPCQSEIFVKITPYNYAINTRDCDEESFFTEEVLAEAGDNIKICKGESTFLEATGGSIYQWSPPDGLNNANINNPIATPITTTLYTVAVSNENGCADFDSVLVEIIPQVNVEPQLQNICSGETIDIDLNTENGSNEIIQVTFDDNSNIYGENNHTFPNGQGTINDVLTITNPEICDYQIVKYYAQVDIDGETCETIFDTIEVVVYPPPNIVNHLDTVLCYENLPHTISLDGECGYSNNYSYEWQDDLGGIFSNSENIEIDTSYDIGFHTFIITITDELGCNNIDSIQIDITTIDSLDIDIIGDTIICEADSTILQAIGDFETFEWSTSDTSSSITIYPDSTSTYWLYATNEYGCTITDSVTIYISTPVSPVLPDTISFCKGYISTFTAPTGYSSYTWYYESTSLTLVSMTKTIIIDKAGKYILEVINDDSCSIQNTLFATEEDQITPTIIGDTSICFDTPNTLIIVSGGDFTFYEWRYNDASGDLVIPESNKDSLYLKEGTYYLYVSDGQCTGSIIFTIIRKQKIEFEISPSVDTIELCFGHDTTLIGPAGYYSYEWSSGIFNDTLKLNDTLKHVGNGKYYLTVTNSEGCQGIDSIFIKELADMQPTLEDSIELCADDTIYISPGLFSDYIWYKENTHLVGFDGLDSIKISEAGIYIVKVFNTIGCSAYDTIIINKTNQLNLEIFGIKDLCDNEKIILKTSNNYYKYTWKNDNKILSTNDSLSFVMPQGKDTFTIDLIVESKNGCKGYLSKTIYRYHTPLLQIDDNIHPICGSGSTYGNSVLNFDDFFTFGNKNIGNWIDIDNSKISHNADWTIVNFESVEPDSIYRFVFTTNSANLPCQNISDTLYISVDKCNCDIKDASSRIIPVDDCEDKIGSIYTIEIDSLKSIKNITWVLSHGEIIAGQNTKAIITDWINIDNSISEISISAILENEYCSDSLNLYIYNPKNNLQLDSTSTIFNTCGSIIYNKDLICPNRDFYMGWVDHNTGEYNILENQNEFYFIDTDRDTLSQRSYFVNCSDCSSTNVLDYRNVDKSIYKGCEDGEIIEIQLYPNPNNGEFILSLKGEYKGIITYEIFNTLGEKIRKSEINKQNNIINENIKIDTKSGVYFLRALDKIGNSYSIPILVIQYN